jgi:hypothetical protein
MFSQICSGTLAAPLLLLLTGKLGRRAELSDPLAYRIALCVSKPEIGLASWLLAKSQELKANSAFLRSNPVS